jgi:hypothetical protein
MKETLTVMFYIKMEKHSFLCNSLIHVRAKPNIKKKKTNGPKKKHIKGRVYFALPR